MSVSWIPSEAIEGITKLPFELGVGHYDDPPPDVVDDVDQLHATGAFRFANVLRAWIDVENGHIVGHGHAGRSYISPTLMAVGPVRVAFQPTPFPDLRSIPEVSPSEVSFVQVAGGRPGVPAPRVVRKNSYVTLAGPNVWTTLRLTMRADGSSAGVLTGASSFPRHWVYDNEGRLVAKSGMTDFEEWYGTAFDQSPWGAYDEAVMVTPAETALERQLSVTIMRRGAKPQIRRLRRGAVLTKQGERGHQLFLLLDGVLQVEVDGNAVGEVGPGAIVGERAILEAGTRTATLRAVTNCRVAVADRTQIDRGALRELSIGHRREG